MNDQSLDMTVDALRTALGRESRRADVVASNLANVDTPEYRALAVRFDDFLSSNPNFEPHRTNPMHLSGFAAANGKGTLFEAPITRMRDDGNTVDVDLEMTKLAMAQGRYRTSAEILRKRFALLVYSATDGRGGA